MTPPSLSLSFSLSPSLPQVVYGEGVAGGPGDISLLEVIDVLGQPGSVGPEVRVVVQRVYSSYVPDRPMVSAARPRAPPSVALPRRRGRSRYGVA